MMKLAAVALIASILCRVQSVQVDCTFETAKGISFDLTRLRDAETPFRTADTSVVEKTNRTVVWRLCRDIAKAEFPKTYDGISCENTLKDPKDDSTSRNIEVMAFVMREKEDTTDEQKCRRLTGSLTDTPLSTWYADSNDRAKGVQLEIRGGDNLVKNGSPGGLSVTLLCASDTTVPTASPFTESYMTMTTSFMSIYGCPIQCSPNYETGSYCSGHGTCFYDPDELSTSCRCSSGWKGENCDQSVGVSLNTIFLVINLVLVAIIVITIGYMGLKLRKIRLNPDAAQDSDKRFNQLGAMNF